MGSSTQEPNHKVTFLNDVCKIQAHDMQPDSDFILIDGAKFVHTNSPTTETFLEYSKTFAMKIEKNLEKHLRVDVIFDK